jgi:hypothetical protein
MIKKIFKALSFLVLFPLSIEAQVTSTETFETETTSSTSFTDNSQVFNITSQSHGPFDIQTAYPGTGWNGTAADNVYIDNDGFAVGGQGTGFTISTAGAVPFTIKSLWMYLADNTANVNVTGTLTIVGKLGGATQFTATKTSPFNNTNVGVSNGFTLIDFTTFGGGNNSNISIDQLVFTTTTNFNYVGLDAFTWATVVCSAVTVSPVSQTNIACNGGSTGAASASASGGSGFTYNWTPGNPTGDGTASVTGLTAGNWTCTVTNSCGNSGATTFTVTQPSALVISPVSQTNIACNGGSNGAASVSVSGGTTSYSYNWTPGNPTGDGTASVTGLTFGNWTCTVTDANSCTSATTFTVTQPSALVVTPVSQTNIACNGGSNGAASVSVSGGTTSYSYNWTPGNPTGDGTASVTGLTFGNWTCTVTDANSCTSAKTFTVTQPSTLSLSIASQTNVSTYGGSDGTASVNAASGGTPGYTYNWTPGNPTGDGTTSVTGLIAGTWTCTVTDANSCSTSQTFTITQPAAGPAAALNFDGSDDIVQSNNSINTTLALSNKITVEAWINPTNANYLGCIVGNYQTSGSGMQFLLRRDYSNYVFWVDNGSGFQNVTSTVTVTTGVWTHVAGTWDGNVMKIYINGVLTGTTAVTGSNFASSSNQLWLGGNTAGTPEMFTGSMDEVRIWNKALCQSEIQNNMNCEIASSGTGLLVNYHFNQGNNNANNSGVTTLTDASGNSNNATLTNFALNGTTSNWFGPGAVTSGVSCSPFTVSSVTVSPSVQNNVSCSGGSNGAASVSASGGSNLTYDWTPGNPTGDGTASVTGLTQGSWTCTVTNDCGGTGLHVFTISEPSLLTASSSAGTILCNGGATTVTVSASGGTSAYTGTGTFTVSAGVNSYTVTDANNCTATTTVSISEPSVLNATASAGTIACSGGVTTVTVSATGGTPSYTGTGTFTVTASGTQYNYIVNDANNCTTVASVSVTDPTPLNITANAGTINCNGAATTVSVSASGGTPAYTGPGTFTATAGSYTYTVMDANSCSTSTVITINEPAAITTTQSPTLCAGQAITVGTNVYSTTATYTDVLTAVNGCDSTVITNLTVNASIDKSTTSSGPTVTANATGAAYQWLDCNAGNTAIPGETNQTYTATVTGNYAVIVTVGNCSDTSLCVAVNVTGISGNNFENSLSIYPNPFTNELTITGSTKCKAVLYSMLGEKINEFNLETKPQTINVSDLAPGIYFIQVTDRKIKIIKQ